MLLVIVVAFSGCIQSDATKINGISSNVNTHLKNGDNYFNKAASDLNKFSYNSTSVNCNNALTEFNSAKSAAQEGLTYAQNTNDSVFINYMQLTVSEIDARVNATLELQQAINYLQTKDSTNGNSHVTLVNQYMDTSMNYKAKKDSIVKQNPSKFKQ